MSKRFPLITRQTRIVGRNYDLINDSFVFVTQDGTVKTDWFVPMQSLTIPGDASDSEVLLFLAQKQANRQVTVRDE